ncbi:uncharacterized protein LOC122046039 [Zingiber officinale]|uniref:DUF868 family protein n=1 Tax=Zingiber officinale TaxID=94328 RepID=A0A8J5HW78_ZINOF|nr:uncharacterized protein LOC122046039 [Zingiber officinale]KAG6524493.1 hypothetical protein ZIOFF_014405 [Zingiber officinale]
MPDRILVCFRGGGAAAAGPSVPSLTTSVYETCLGVACLTWSRDALGVSLCAVLRFYADADEEKEEEEEEEVLSFCIRPLLLWKRRGARRFHLKDRRRVDFNWDLTRARFPPGGGPEPVSGYSVSASLDGAVLLVAGDLADAAPRKSKAHTPQISLIQPPISRREHVVLGDHGGGRCYRTRARFGGQDHQIAIDLEVKEKGREAAMSVEIDGERILLVRRLRWKFRGNEKVELGDSKIQVSWDLHKWFFQAMDEGASAGAASGVEEMGQAVFLLRFEEDEKQTGSSLYKGSPAAGHNTDWGRGSGDGCCWERQRRRGRRLRKTDSSSSSASTGSASTVIEWASAEEEEMRRAEGFSLLVYAWKH